MGRENLIKEEKAGSERRKATLELREGPNE